LSATTKHQLTTSFHDVMHTAKFENSADFMKQHVGMRFCGQLVVEAPPRMMIGGSTFTAKLLSEAGNSDPNKATHFVLERDGTTFPPQAMAGPFAIHKSDPKAKHSGLTEANFKDLKGWVEADMAKSNKKEIARLPGVDLRYTSVDIDVPAKGVMGGTSVRAWIPGGIAGMPMKPDLNKLLEEGTQFFVERSNANVPPAGGTHFFGPFETAEK
ncbi:MAG TPA: hypothetical protein VGO62_01625, partial [Myxococcota bacterium]